MTATEELVGDFGAIRESLIPAYIDYCENVSPRSMAMSLEACTFLYWLCQERNAARVADFGSGFTSFVLRRYAASDQGSTLRTSVMSVDDNPEWLTKTAGFLNDQGFAADGLMLWSDYVRAGLTHDLIVYDFSSGHARNAGMDQIADHHLEPGGAVLFDDANHSGHFAKMMEVAQRCGLDLMEVRDVTIDATGRFDLLAIKP